MVRHDELADELRKVREEMSDLYTELADVVAEVATHVQDLEAEVASLEAENATLRTTAATAPSADDQQALVSSVSTLKGLVSTPTPEPSHVPSPSTAPAVLG
jgi:phage shock protein A